MKKLAIPENYQPCDNEVRRYLNVWNGLDGYADQELALDKLFETLCPRNDNLQDVLLKCSVLNDFYSTHIFNIFKVAKHILSIENLDTRLVEGEYAVVDEIARCSGRIIFSFATKYCSHHFPKSYAIYDNYVAQTLQYFRDRDTFAKFRNEDLRQYKIFHNAILTFQKFYDINLDFTLKEMDKYLWQFGKRYFSTYPTTMTPELKAAVELKGVALDDLDEMQQESLLRDLREELALKNCKTN